MTNVATTTTRHHDGASGAVGCFDDDSHQHDDDGGMRGGVEGNAQETLCNVSWACCMFFSLSHLFSYY